MSLSQVFTVNKQLLIDPPVFKKIENKVVGGLVVPGQKTEFVECKVFADFTFDSGEKVMAGDYVLLRGDSGLQQWAKEVYDYDSKRCVLCPAQYVVGIKVSP
jgi:hypothetical protein